MGWVPGWPTPGPEQAEAHFATVIQVGVEPHPAPCMDGMIWLSAGVYQEERHSIDSRQEARL